MLVIPFAAKRAAFSGIQASHRLPIRGAMPNPIRTGYETIIAHQVDPHFAYAAEDDGIIKEMGVKYVTINYKDGREVQLEIGVRIASSKGTFFKHVLVCDLPVGHRFKKGDVIIFNQSFFVRDIFNPTQVILTDRTYLTTQIIDSNDTYEDSSALSVEATEMMEAHGVKERVAIFDATDYISEVVSIGDHIDIDDFLMLVEDKSFAGADDRFGQQSTEILRKLSRNAPKAGVKGKVVSMDCFFFCEEEELSPSVKEVVGRIVKHTFAGTKTKVADKRLLSGKINEPLKIKGNLLGPGKVAIRFYIETKLSCGAGDKFVFSSQLKNTMSRKIVDPHYTESGRRIDAMFSYASISARIVGSPEFVGTLYPLLHHVTKEALKAYDS